MYPHLTTLEFIGTILAFVIPAIAFGATPDVHNFLTGVHSRLGTFTKGIVLFVCATLFAGGVVVTFVYGALNFQTGREVDRVRGTQVLDIFGYENPQFFDVPTGGCHGPDEAVLLFRATERYTKKMRAGRICDGNNNTYIVW
jgi:hypothetical protein